MSNLNKVRFPLKNGFVSKSPETSPLKSFRPKDIQLRGPPILIENGLSGTESDDPENLHTERISNVLNNHL